MKWIAALIVCLQALMLPGAALAQTDYGNGQRIISTETWVEEWDPAQQRWVRVDDSALAAGWQARSRDAETVVDQTPGGTITTHTYQAARYAFPDPGHLHPAHVPQVIAQYGPFVVLSERRAALTGSTDTASPHQFEAMLRDFPGIAVLEMIEAPGTSNDIANLAVGRRIREAGIVTHVPRGGSVRSGAVELFLAGAQRTMEQGAQFAVHSWLDNHGRQPGDFAADAPENRLYLDYYVEMGMTEGGARDFYAMTNSVPHSGAKWMDAHEMQVWIEDQERVPAIRNLPAALPIFARGGFVIAVADTPAIVLPELTVEGLASLASAPMVASQPMIGYGDVVRSVEAMSLVSAKSFASDAFLDS